MKHDTYIVKLDYKINASGTHSLFVRGNLQNDHEKHPPQFPGQPPFSFITNNSKGIAAGYTALISNNVINNFRYAFIRQGLGTGGLNSQDFVNFRGLDDTQGLGSQTILTNVPVSNFVDDISWTRGKHTIQFGTNWRLIHNNRESNADNISTAQTNLYWLNPSFIANQGVSLDPSQLDAAAGGPYPDVDTNFGTSYSFAAMDVAGVLSETFTKANQNKLGQQIPNGQLVPRHFQNFEGELYLQDKWSVTPNLVLTYGVRYSLLQPPFENAGNQVSPTVDMDQWFKTRGQNSYQGSVVQPDLTFDLSGKANGAKPFWAWDYKNLAPRLAIAYSPHAASGFWHSLFGDAGKSSIRAGYGIYFDHFGEGVVNTFDRNGSWGLTSAFSNPAGVSTVDSAPRYTQLTGLGSLPAAEISPSPSGFPYTSAGQSQYLWLGDCMGHRRPSADAVFQKWSICPSRGSFPTTTYCQRPTPAVSRIVCCRKSIWPNPAIWSTLRAAWIISMRRSCYQKLRIRRTSESNQRNQHSLLAKYVSARRWPSRYLRLHCWPSSVPNRNPEYV